jgi:hypothetical protein
MVAVTAFVTMTKQLDRAGLDVRDARESYDDARDARDSLIVEASDEGMPQRAISRAAGISQQRVVAILIDRAGFNQAG